MRIFLFLFILILLTSIGYLVFLYYVNKNEGIGVQIGGSDAIPEMLTRRERRGIKGEQKVNHSLRLLLKQNEYLLSNIVIPLENETFCEIDCILVSNKGIFCIETKSWRGIISGGNKDNYWVQTYSKRSVTKNKMYNPVMQNQNHCNAIEEKLNYKYPVDNIVIFTNQTDFRCIQSKSVFTIDDFKKCYSYLENNQLTNKQIIEVVDKLVPFIANVIA